MTTSEWEAAYDSLYAEFGQKWPLFPTRESYLEHWMPLWRSMYDEHDSELSVRMFVQHRIAAINRICGPIGPVQVVKRGGARYDAGLWERVAPTRREAVGYYADPDAHERIEISSRVPIVDFRILSVDPEEEYRKLRRWGTPERRSLFQVTIPVGVGVVLDGEEMIILPPGIKINITNIIAPIYDDGVQLAARLYVGSASQEE